jgi:hypothetical protein
VWDNPGNGVITPAQWTALTDKASIAPASIAVAFDVNPERTRGSIGLYGERADGLGHVELVDSRPGVEWMAAELAGIASRNNLATPLTCAPTSPAGGLIPDLEALGIEVRRANMPDVSQACTSFLDAVTAGQLRHTGQPQLAAQATAARQQVSGDSWRWTRKGIDDISGFYTVNLARWAYLTREVKPAALVPSIHFL